jgi:hypothetical protein
MLIMVRRRLLLLLHGMRGISLSRVSRLRTVEVDDRDSSDLYRRYVHHLVSTLGPARIVGILIDVVSIRRMTGLGWGGSFRLLTLLLIRSCSIELVGNKPGNISAAVIDIGK